MQTSWLSLCTDWDIPPRATCAFAGLDALKDQSAAEAFMRVFGSLVFLAPAIPLTALFLTHGRLIDETTGLERARATA